MEQFIFDKKWALIKEKSNQKGISLFGDMPFYAALDSADVWANPQLFDLDRNLLPIKMGGVPPDYFPQLVSFGVRRCIDGNGIYLLNLVGGEGDLQGNLSSLIYFD